jgi:N-acetyl-gamma-glutamyl-phosphate reductase
MNDSAPARVGILGATGYTGRELVGLLARHPGVEIGFATSQSEAGASLRAVHRAAPELALVRAEDAPLGEVDVVFCCLPHGESARWAEAALRAGARVIDLSHDLRVASANQAWAADAVYGLPELYRERIRGAQVVANPGCYPTAALLAIAPLLRRGAVAGPVIINAASGVTGAGRSPKRELLFAEVAEDYRAYAAGNTHRHLNELRDQTAQLADQPAPELVFTPHLLPVKRGILETIYVPVHPERLPAAAVDAWLEDYAGEPFVEVMTDRLPSLADVVASNRVAIGVTPVAGMSAPLLTVVAAIDNLTKGAAGQAVQNMNLLLGFPEAEGLPC